MLRDHANALCTFTLAAHGRIRLGKRGPLQKPPTRNRPLSHRPPTPGVTFSLISANLLNKNGISGFVACICMPLMTIEFEHLFICLLAIYVNKSLTFMEPLKNSSRPPPSGAQRPEPWAGGGRGRHHRGQDPSSSFRGSSAPASEGSTPPASEGVQKPVKDPPAGSARSVHPQPAPQASPAAPHPPGLCGPRVDDSSLARPQLREICLLTGNSASG